ncbi:MAG: FkbM family methyltransferase [Archangium sp.]|nr:FkbM family methyltransferase [Archangium sp.]MDP3151042.1 FkbM family methyltransferase [Archangium sp.]MDP3569785.1 FkbM family methyltransferase [Archangium sp.]
MISYAQNFEDVMLWRALRHIENGFYVDIGAQDPIIDSVSMGLYEQGWRGVHVEPTPAYAEALRVARPGERVVQVAIGTEAALIPFFEIPGTGISTGDAEIAGRHEAAGYAHRRIEVPCITLSTLFDTLPARDVHWLKVDVEGMEGQVLRSWAPSPVRPWIVLVESTRPRTADPSFEDWESVILGLGYQFAYSDGLNRYYVSEAHPELLAKFATPPNVFDDFSLSGFASNGFCARLTEVIEKQRARIDELDSAWHAHEAKLESLRADAAFRERFVELEKTLVEQRRAADARLDEALAHARQINTALQQMTAAKDEVSVRLAKLQEQEQVRLHDLSLRNQELASFERVVAQRDALIDGLQTQLISVRANATQLKEEFERQREAANAKFNLRSVLTKNPLRSFLGRERDGELIEKAPMTVPKNPPSPSPQASVSFLLTLFDVAFVRAAYEVLLGREADPSGLETYLGSLRGGVTRESIIVEIALSEEAKGLGRVVAGLPELLEEAEANRPNLARRLQQRLGGPDSLESIARMLRAQENRNAAFSTDLDQRLSRLESSVEHVQSIFAEGESLHSLSQAHRSETIEGLRLMAKTRTTHRILQDNLFHRLKAATKR